VGKGFGAVIQTAELLRPRENTGQGELLGEVMDIAHEVNPTPLMQTKRTVVPTVEIRDDNALVIQTQNVGDDMTGTGLGIREESHIGGGETGSVLPVAAPEKSILHETKRRKRPYGEVRTITRQDSHSPELLQQNVAVNQGFAVIVFTLLHRVLHDLCNKVSRQNPFCFSLKRSDVELPPHALRPSMIGLPFPIGM